MKKIVLPCLLALPLIAVSSEQECKIASIHATTPTDQFIDYKNGTVLDKNTALVWKKCSEGQKWNNRTNTCDGRPSTYTWQVALKRVQTINNQGGFAGKTDWRIPNVKELSSIIEQQCTYPTINLAVFPGTPQSAWFWSSSPDLKNGLAWIVPFDYGNVGKTSKSNDMEIRLVRGWQ